MMHISYDEILEHIKYYRLDAVLILSVVRIPWWSMCEYLLDTDQSLDTLYWKYLSMISKTAARAKKAQRKNSSRQPLKSIHDIEMEDQIRRKFDEKHTIDYLPCTNSVLTPDKIAYILNVSLATVDRLIKSETIKPIDEPGETTQVLKSDVLDYVMKRMVAEKPVEFQNRTQAPTISQKNPSKTA